MDAARELAHKHNDKLLIEHLNFIKEVWKASENKNLKKADGSPINELNSIPLEKVKIIVGEIFDDIDDFNKVDKLLEGLNNPSIFSQIFEIVE